MPQRGTQKITIRTISCLVKLLCPKEDSFHLCFPSIAKLKANRCRKPISSFLFLIVRRYGFLLLDATLNSLAIKCPINFFKFWKMIVLNIRTWHFVFKKLNPYKKNPPWNLSSEHNKEEVIIQIIYNVTVFINVVFRVKKVI